MAWHDRRLLRRVVTIPTAIVGAALSSALAPVTVLIAAIVDRGRPWQQIRLVALITGGLAIEMIGLVRSLAAWVMSGFGLHLQRPAHQRRHARLMAWYCSTLLAWVTKVLGTHIEYRLPDDVSGPAVILARHTSFFDALLPATVISRYDGLAGHHVIAAGLRYLPNLDIVGRRIPTAFIKRAGTSDQLDDIAAIGRELDESAVAIIFPEGTFRDEERFARAIERLSERQPDLAASASALRHVMPPRPAGTHALLADIPPLTQLYVCANTGLEDFSTLREIRTSLVARRPIVVELWPIESPSLPADPEAIGAWLLDRFAEVDDWVAAQLRAGC